MVVFADVAVGIPLTHQECFHLLAESLTSKIKVGLLFRVGGRGGFPKAPVDELCEWTPHESSPAEGEKLGRDFRRMDWMHRTLRTLLTSCWVLPYTQDRLHLCWGVHSSSHSGRCHQSHHSVICKTEKHSTTNYGPCFQPGLQWLLQ